MATTQTENQTELLGEAQVGEFGKVAIRVVVLPKVRKPGKAEATQPEILDAEEGELIPEKGATPMSAYLESGKGGKQCCVFLVNGQRQDAMENGFIIQQLGFKYLRNRMMIIVDVDDLTPEAIGRLMQGSRQSFYEGDVRDAILRRIVATLKDDPDLVRLEEEAEEQVAELRAGDAKVKHTLDKLIDHHHEFGQHFAEGVGAQGADETDENLGIKTVTKGGVVSLLPPERGTPADYPVLVSRPAASVRLRPNENRTVIVKSEPPNAWPALAEFTVEDDPSVPELKVAQDRHSDHTQLTLRFAVPADFDTDQYPVRATIKVTARFNGIRQPRQLDLRVLAKPDTPQPEPVLTDPPTWLKVSSREPVKIKLGDADTHVRLRWDGRDELLLGPTPRWTIRTRVADSDGPQPTMNFSEPSGGRLTMLVSPREEWAVGDRFRFEVLAASVDGDSLRAAFTAEVVERPEPREREPRLVDAEIATGASRRPPYDLKYITRDEYETGTCWGNTDWNDEVPGCFQEPTDRTPLVLLVNEDMRAVRDYRRYLTKKYKEMEVERRINKYTSHIAFHLYQMYQSSKDSEGEEYADDVDQRRRDEIGRVAGTLIKLMEVSR